MEQTSAQKLIIGRWKDGEVKTLMDAVNAYLAEGYTVNQACTEASKYLYRSAGSCYQKWLYEERALANNPNLKPTQTMKSEARDLLDRVQEAAPEIEDIMDPIPLPSDDTTVVVPANKSITITIKIG